MENVQILAKSLEYIENHLRDDIKTIDIAEVCYCSNSTIEKMFKYVYHISVHQYIIRRRMMMAAKMIINQPDISILTVALEYGYNSHEAFARAFKEVWNCNPSEFQVRKYPELFPKFREPVMEGDKYVMDRRSVDISQLYDLFCERRECYFIGSDIKEMEDINAVSYKAGDLAIIEAMQRLSEISGEDDIVFRIGGDEFCILTNSTSEEYAKKIVEDIKAKNGETFEYEGKQIPLKLHAGYTLLEKKHIRYSSLFEKLHLTIKDSKN